MTNLKQPDLFDQPNDPKDAARLTNEGIQRAMDHADRVEPGWSREAYEFLMQYIESHDKPFQCEDVRNAAKDIIPDPPSKKAWGGIMRRAKMAGKITRVGFRGVKDPTAHDGLAAVWVVKKYEFHLFNPLTPDECTNVKDIVKFGCDKCIYSKYMRRSRYGFICTNINSFLWDRTVDKTLICIYFNEKR